MVVQGKLFGQCHGGDIFLAKKLIQAPHSFLKLWKVKVSTNGGGHLSPIQEFVKSAGLQQARPSWATTRKKRIDMMFSKIKPNQPWRENL